MANSDRPPLDLDDSTNSLRESSGKGIGAFFPTPPPPPPPRDDPAPVHTAHSPTQVSTRVEPEKPTASTPP
jgi:hypothetical protein